MTSHDIAELVGSRHDNVKRTIGRLVSAGVITQPPMEDGERSANGVVQKVYCFEGEIGKRDSIVVVAQLCPEFTARLVDRWKQLEEERSRPKSQAELNLAYALAQVEQERRLNTVESKMEEVAETIENIKRGSIPAGWIGYSDIKARFGMSPLKCKTLATAYGIPTDTHKFLTPDGVLGTRGIVKYEPFMEALRQVMGEAEKKGTRWFHPKLNIFQLLNWEAK